MEQNELRILASIGVGAQSTVGGGKTFLPENIYMKN